NWGLQNFAGVFYELFSARVPRVWTANPRRGGPADPSNDATGAGRIFKRPHRSDFPRGALLSAGGRTDADGGPNRGTRAARSETRRQLVAQPPLAGPARDI